MTRALEAEPSSNSRVSNLQNRQKDGWMDIKNELYVLVVYEPGR